MFNNQCCKYKNINDRGEPDLTAGQEQKVFIHGYGHCNGFCHCELDHIQLPK
jgi:hypothetical protein